MGAEHIRRNADKGVLELSFDRPERKNALDRGMYEALAEALEEGGRDPGIRAIVFSGGHGDFTSGNDIADFTDPAAFSEKSPVLDFIAGLASATKPLLAAVEGLAVGIGVTLLLHCDIVVAATGSRFRLPFVDLGLVPEAGSTFLLPAIAGRQRAAELMLLGDFFDAPKARDMGFVNELVPDGEARPRALEIAAVLARKPAAAVRETKALLRKGESGDLQAAIRRETEAFRARLSSPEAAEAFAAFAEKRRPDFSRFE